MPRVKMILEHGEGRAFVPFDRFAQDRESEGKSLPQLLDEFAELRARNLDELRALGLTARTDAIARHASAPRNGHAGQSSGDVGGA